MADLSKVKVLGTDYNLKDAAARGRLDTAETNITNLQSSKQAVIDASNKLAAAYVSLTKPEGSDLTSTDVQAAIYELEAAIEAGGTGSVVTVEQQGTAEAGYFATYVIKQGGSAVAGPKINIPKDFLVKSASIKEVTKKDEPYTGAEVGDKYIDFVINVKEGTATDEHLYLPVNELVDAYQADETSIHMENNTFSVNAVAMEKVTGLADALALKADKADYVAKTTKVAGIDLADDITYTELQTALGLENLAYADTASGTVPGQDITGVKATGNLSGSASITLTSTATTYTIPDAQKADYTPAGSITGSAISDGDIEVTLKDAANATEASIEYATDAYVPAGTVSGTVSVPNAAAIALAGDGESGFTTTGTVSKPDVDVTVSASGTVKEMKTAGTAYTISDGGVSQGSDTTASFVKKGYKIAMDTTDTECLNISLLTAADTDFFDDAVTASGEISYTKQELSGALPTFGDSATFLQGVTAALHAAPTFTGEKIKVGLTNANANIDATFAATNSTPVIDAVKYLKQEVDTAEFSGTAATLGFSGTESKNLIPTAITYDKANASQSGNVSITGAELAVGTISVTAKEVTVTPNA